MRRRVPIILLAVAAGVSLAVLQGNARSAVAERVRTLTRDSAWKLVSTVPVRFMTHHPQGMVKIGNDFFVSAVDKIRGVGHLFKIGPDGNRLADIRLGEDEIYHPGGIDYDGENIWVPVGEYRRDSRSIIYRVNAVTMKATEVFRFADHIGAIVHNTDDHTLHGVSWGSRRFYRWTLGPDGRVTNGGTPPEAPHAVHGRHGDAPGTGGTAVPAWRNRARGSCRRPSATPGAGPPLDTRRAGHDTQPGMD
jgi:hypothetical protein